MATITGTTEGDLLFGSTHFGDSISALGGDDTVIAGLGNDTIQGNFGNDFLYGDWGSDRIFGGDGNDRLYSGGDSDTLYGDDGDDFIEMNSPVWSGESTGYGGAGNDLFIFYSAYGTAYGGDGIDTLGLFWLYGGLAVDFRTATPTMESEGQTITLVSVEKLQISSTSANDTIYGSAYGDIISVSSGLDLVDAGAGNDDVFYVPSGAHTLEGGADTDFLTVYGIVNVNLSFIVDGVTGVVDDGNSSVIQGFEVYTVYGSNGNDTARLWTGTDIFVGYDGNDTAFGHSGNDTLRGEAGADSLTGDAGRDSLVGGNHNDTIDGGADGDQLLGINHDDLIYGGAGNDFISGGNGLDVIYGGDGNDRIIMYLGNDTQYGGAGADRFAFNQNQTGFHTIMDFEVGVDRLEFTSYFVPLGPPPGALDPSLLSYGTAVGPQAQFVLVYDPVQNMTVLLWDTNGASPAGGYYGFCQFAGQVNLTAADFLIV